MIKLDNFIEKYFFCEKFKKVTQISLHNYENVV